ncbi:hypothetical protein E3N88_38556 [Mikania micrantha]|uniref:Uncharacterized protein n=1 Tax=Mikania micrantha TaxID=192012 RepID=A0A5N6LUD5_9ASTR|nr:hypothetical protein E3N88_38556 [Mikania micrantha]
MYEGNSKSKCIFEILIRKKTWSKSHSGSLCSEESPRRPRLSKESDASGYFMAIPSRSIQRWSQALVTPYMDEKPYEKSEAPNHVVFSNEDTQGIVTDSVPMQELLDDQTKDVNRD